MLRLTKATIFALLIAGVAAAAFLLTQRFDGVDTAEQIETDLRSRAGLADVADARALAQTLIVDGVDEADAVDVAGTLIYFGVAALGDTETARLLARFEQSAPADSSPSRDLLQAAEQLGVDVAGLPGFLRVVERESDARQLPLGAAAAGLLEHGVEVAAGCETAEGAACPADAVVRLVLDRQQAGHEQ